MSKISLVTQIVMIAIAVGIGFLYMKPTIASIRVTQDNIDSYDEETENVSTVNQDLKAKLDKINSVTNADAEELARFIPDKVDEVTVLKELQNIIAVSGLNSFTADYGGTAGNTSKLEDNELTDIDVHTFTLSGKADYEQLKSLLSLIEVNDYLLQISDLSIKPGLTKYLDIKMTLSVFSRATDPSLVDVANVEESIE